MEAKLSCGLRAEMEKDLGNTGFYVEGIAQLFRKYRLSGWEEDRVSRSAEPAARPGRGAAEPIAVRGPTGLALGRVAGDATL